MQNSVESNVPKKEAENPCGEEGEWRGTAVRRGWPLSPDGWAVGGNQKRFLEKAVLSLFAAFQDHPGLCSKSTENVAFSALWLLAARDGALDHKSSFTSCLMGYGQHFITSLSTPLIFMFQEMLCCSEEEALGFISA